MNNYRLMMQVRWLGTMVPNSLEARAKLANELGKGQDIYARVMIAIAQEARRARQRILTSAPDCDVGFLTVLGDGNFQALEEAGADVPGAIEAQMAALQFVPPIESLENMKQWAVKAAQLILQHRAAWE
jgi:hypothetical protein